VISRTAMAAVMLLALAAVAWADVVAILVIARLCEPSSELHIAERWYRTTALDDLLGVPIEQVVAGLEAVTPVEIERVAQRLFQPERFVLAVVGPQADDEALARIISA